MRLKFFITGTNSHSGRIPMVVSSGLKRSQRVSKRRETLGAEHARASHAVSPRHETLAAERRNHVGGGCGLHLQTPARPGMPSIFPENPSARWGVTPERCRCLNLGVATWACKLKAGMGKRLASRFPIQL